MTVRDGVRVRVRVRAKVRARVRVRVEVRLRLRLADHLAVLILVRVRAGARAGLGLTTLPSLSLTKMPLRISSILVKPTLQLPAEITARYGTIRPNIWEI